MKRASLVVVAALASFASSLLIAQTSNPPGQAGPTPSSTPPKSNALVLGQVVDGSSGEPVAEALVTLTQIGGGRRGVAGPGALPAGASPQMQQAMEAAMAAAGASGRTGGPQRVMTGADGRFVFHSLPPGSIQLTATLTGYSSSLAVNVSAGLGGLLGGGINPQAPPVTVALKEGEHATGLKMRLWKNAVVSGVVRDDGGEPAIGVSVQVARRVMAAGRARFVPASLARTDDRGAFRISALVPGDYLVVVPQTQVSIPTALMTGLIEMVTSMATTGSAAALAGGGMALIDVMSSGINPTDAMSGGVRIGDFMVASTGSVPLVGADGRLQAYQTMFYPGAPSPAQATVVSLKSGEDRTDVNFQLRLIPTSRVSGVAMGPDGPAANLGIRLVVPGDGAVSESEFDVATAVSKADGGFAFYGVPPGQFLLRATKQPRPEMSAEMMANPQMAAMFGGIKSSPDALFAAAVVNVSGNDVDGVVLQLTTGFRVSGRFEFQSLTGRAAPLAAQLQSMSVTLTAMDGRNTGGGLGQLGFSGPDRSSPQGEFRTKGYAPGRYFFSASGSGPWQVKSAMIGGRDVLDTPIEIRESDITSVVVTFTDRLASLTGTVRAAGETDLSETVVILFPANHRAWVESGMNPRRARTARSSRAGAYSIPSVPAGDYLIAAIDRGSEGDMQDPAYFEMLSRIGTRVTVGTDAVVTADVTKARVTR